MPMILTEASSEALLRAVEQLPIPELEAFVADVLALRARRVAPSLTGDESALFARINQGVPEQLQDRYDALVAKRRAETITAEEDDEFIRLSDDIEILDAERVAALAELAQLRGVTLRALMDDLGIRPPADV